MTTWLTVGSRVAHAFGDDEDDDVAACGFELDDYCSECGGRPIVKSAGPRDQHCGDCTRALSSRDGGG